MRKDKSLTPRKLTGGTIDIETYPGSYRTYPDNFYETFILKEDKPIRLASFSYKPLNGKPYTRGHWQYPSYRAFVKDLHRIFAENDYLVGHNAKDFDLRTSNSFFGQLGLPKTNTEIIDTKTEIKRSFRLPSYRLKYVLVYFGIGEKIETGGEGLWFKTEQGDREARTRFLEYNENDTVQTEKLYLFLLNHGWIRKVPGAKLYVPGEGCWRCHVEDTQSRGEKPRAQGFVHEYMCKNCGQRLYTSIVRPYAKQSI